MATSKLKTDSPVSRRIVLAFLDFLNSVEPAPGIDLEGLEVVRECLGEVFKLNSSSSNGQTKPNLLVDYFSSLDENKQKEIKADQCPTATSVDAPSTSTQNASAYDTNPSASSKPLAKMACFEKIRKMQNLCTMSQGFHTSYCKLAGVSKDELFGQFFGALEKIYFFNTTTDGHEDPAQLDKATNLFHDAVLMLLPQMECSGRPMKVCFQGSISDIQLLLESSEMERSGCQLNSTNLADTFKSKGNKAMQLKLYNDAIELYTYAIAVCENNSVYYCNRAAAFTQIHKYMEAIRDCYKSIEIDPSYSKAYSRLGLAYYAQGNYSDAINKGFLRALLLDPNSVSIRENIRVAEQKLNEETQRTGQDQNAGSTTHNNQVPSGQSTGGGSRSTGVPPSFMSSAFNSGVLPADMANMFMNIAGNTFQGQQPSQERPVNGSHTFQFNEPEIRVSGNVNLNVEEVPEELMGTWRSVMGMFQGAQPHQQQQGDTNRGPTPPTN